MENLDRIKNTNMQKKCYIKILPCREKSQFVHERRLVRQENLYRWNCESRVIWNVKKKENLNGRLFVSTVHRLTYKIKKKKYSSRFGKNSAQLKIDSNATGQNIFRIFAITTPNNGANNILIDTGQIATTIYNWFCKRNYIFEFISSKIFNSSAYDEVYVNRIYVWSVSLIIVRA